MRLTGDQKKLKKNHKKSHSAEQNRKGDPLVSYGFVCYGEKKKELLWFSSLDQIVQFDL